MATQPDEGEPLELTEELEVEEPAAAAEPEEVPPEDGEEPDEDGETTISFGDDETEDDPDDSTVIRDFRRREREHLKRIRELETAQPQPKKIDRRPEPTMEEYDWDEALFKEEWRKWNAEEQAATADERNAAEAEAAMQREWQQDVSAYAEKKARLAADIPDLDDLLATVASTFSPEQYATMVKAANDPAMFQVALAKNPAKLGELAKIKDYVKLGAAIARMEGGIKVVKKRKAPAPDRTLSGSAAVTGKSAAIEQQLEKLEAEADRKGGDRTAVRAFKKKHDLL